MLCMYISRYVGARQSECAHTAVTADNGVLTRGVVAEAKRLPSPRLSLALTRLQLAVAVVCTVSNRSCHVESPVEAIRRHRYALDF